jgi:dTDP-glucose 4,6-dehydratase
MLRSSATGPVNLGNPVERTVLELAQLVLDLTGSSSSIEFHRLPQDDPTRRRPDITRARQLLGWEPRVAVTDGLRQTIEWFTRHRAEVTAAASLVAGGQYEGRSAPAQLRSLAS